MFLRRHLFVSSPDSLCRFGGNPLQEQEDWRYRDAVCLGDIDGGLEGTMAFETPIRDFTRDYLLRG